MSEQTLKALRAPVPANLISRLPKGGAMLDYVGHAATTKIILDADDRWNWEPLSMTDEGLPRFDDAGGLWIKLTIGGVTRLGYGDAGGKKGPNATKEAIGDAIRNAAMRFGVALELWSKADFYENPEAEGAADVISGEQLAELQKLIDDTGSDVVKFCQYLKIQTLELMPAAAFSNAKALLENKKRVTQ
jgi:hypothetical protein